MMSEQTQQEGGVAEMMQACMQQFMSQAEGAGCGCSDGEGMDMAKMMEMMQKMAPACCTEFGTAAPAGPSQQQS